MHTVLDFIELHRDRYFDELKQFLAIPSISALPDHKDDVRRCADWVCGELGRIGLQHVTLHETAGHPIIFGPNSRCTPAAPISQRRTGDCGAVVDRGQ